MKLLIGVVVVSCVVWVMNTHGARFQAAMQDYEECVLDKTGMTPSSYYQKMGYYPECCDEGRCTSVMEIKN